MKKRFCALLCAALTLTFAARAEEPAPEATAEIVNIEAVQVGSPVTPAPESSAAPELTASVAPSPTPDAGLVRMGFEDGFALVLPEGWRYYPLDEAMAAQGVVYCLSDAEAQNWLYIQRWDSDCADMNALKALIDRSTEPQTSGVYNFNGQDFVVYDLAEGDLSCCAALWRDSIINFVFTPQSDADFMAVAAQVMDSFSELAI